MGDSVLLKTAFMSQFELLRVGGQSGTEQKKQQRQFENSRKSWEKLIRSRLYAHFQLERGHNTPRLKFNAVKLGVLVSRRMFMYLHAMNLFIFYHVNNVNIHL